MRRVANAALGMGLSMACVVLASGWGLAAPDDGLVGIKAGTTKIVHRPACALLKRVLPKNKIELADIAAAEADGFKPCTVCKPGAEAMPAPGPAGKNTAGKKGGAGGKAVSDAPGIVFSRDVAPVFVANCLGCHEGAQAKKQFDMGTFARLMQGGASGKAIEPADPGASELVLRIKGESQGRKMPPGNNNDLADATIARIETWVREGAKLDGGFDPTAPIKSYAPTPDDLRRAELARMNPEQRDQLAETKGRERLKKASSSATFDKHSSPHFVLLANIPRDRADALLKRLEPQVASVKAVLGPDSTKAVEGPIKIGIYVFNEVNPYVEFIRAVENREVEPGTVAHARLDVEAPYVVAVDPLAGREDPNLSKKSAPAKAAKGKKGQSEEGFGPERTLDGLVAEKLAENATRVSGKAPSWLVAGVGSYVGSQMDPRSRQFTNLRSLALRQGQQGWVDKVKDAFRGEADAETQRALGFAFVEWLASTQPVQLAGFVQAVEAPAENQKLEDIIKQGWNMEPDQLYEIWGAWVSGAYAGGRR
ncbi:MAG: c-type cytochrome domain-containing protein [Isosphaeraceae bacterium]